MAANGDPTVAWVVTTEMLTLVASSRDQVPSRYEFSRIRPSGSWKYVSSLPLLSPERVDASPVAELACNGVLEDASLADLKWHQYLVAPLFQYRSLKQLTCPLVKRFQAQPQE